MNSKNIDVSILCITYNHEAYIRDALEGILHQDIDYNYEVIVHDDASTDKTPQIIREYENKYPDKIRCIYQKENQYSAGGAKRILTQVFNLCRGRYIALCEGDDFWIDDHKLKIQLDWMEKHTDYFMTAHNALRMDYTQNTLRTINPYTQEKEICPEELIMQYNGNLPTASIVIRDNIRNIEPFFWDCGIGDVPMQLYSMMKGRIYYFDRIMSVYRHNHCGSWCVDTLGIDKEKVIIHYAKMIRFAHEYDSYTSKRFSIYLHELTLNCLASILYQCKDFSVSEFRYKIQMLLDKQEESLREYLCDIAEAYEQFYSENYISAKIRDFIDRYQRLYIWGTGNFGTKLAQKFKDNDIGYAGFVISDEVEMDKEYMERPVYHISDVKNTVEDISIIVAVNRSLWRKLRHQLEDQSNIKYCYMLSI